MNQHGNATSTVLFYAAQDFRSSDRTVRSRCCGVCKAWPSPQNSEVGAELARRHRTEFSADQSRPVTAPFAPCGRAFASLRRSRAYPYGAAPHVSGHLELGRWAEALGSKAVCLPTATLCVSRNRLNFMGIRPVALPGKYAALENPLLWGFRSQSRADPASVSQERTVLCGRIGHIPQCAFATPQSAGYTMQAMSDPPRSAYP